MREYIQLLPNLCVPQKKAELALRDSGVMEVLKMGIDTRHYLDRREGDTCFAFPRTVLETTDESPTIELSLAEKWLRIRKNVELNRRENTVMNQGVQ